MSTAIANSIISYLPELYRPSYVSSVVTERSVPIGIGADFLVVLRKGTEMQEKMAKIQQNLLELRFIELRDEWWQDIRVSSSLSDAVNHQAYREIISMGPKVVPIILRELQRRPNHWFYALSLITGEDPVKEEDWGRLVKMTEAWLEWGRERGLV